MRDRPSNSYAASALRDLIWAMTSPCRCEYDSVQVVLAWLASQRPSVRDSEDAFQTLLLKWSTQAYTRAGAEKVAALRNLDDRHLLNLLVKATRDEAVSASPQRKGRQALRRHVRNAIGGGVRPRAGSLPSDLRDEHGRVQYALVVRAVEVALHSADPGEIAAWKRDPNRAVADLTTILSCHYLPLEGQGEVDDQAASGEQPDNAVRRQHDSHVLEAVVVRKLGPENATVVSLRLRGTTFEEIGRTLGRPRSTMEDAYKSSFKALCWVLESSSSGTVKAVLRRLMDPAFNPERISPEARRVEKHLDDAQREAFPKSRWSRAAR